MDINVNINFLDKYEMKLWKVVTHIAGYRDFGNALH